MRAPLSLFLFSLLAMGQAPPPEVDQTLRARVTEFYQDHVDGSFRKAFDLVADDSKDFYFGANKTQFKSFHIDKIDYKDNFTKAIVTLTVQRTMNVQTQQVLIPSTGPTSWKIENGKWVWYNDPGENQTTPMGPSDLSAIKPNPDGTVTLPKRLTPEMIAAAAKRIIGQQQSGVSKSEVTLPAGAPSSEQVIFHNGAPGAVQATLEVSPKLKGFRAELDKTSVNAGENAMLKIAYEPEGQPPATEVAVRLMVRPFNQVFTVNVKFADPDQSGR
jgi:hypothetical protein